MSEVLNVNEEKTWKRKTHTERLEKIIKDFFLSRPKGEALARDVVGNLAELKYKYTPSSSALGEKFRKSSHYKSVGETAEGTVWRYVGPTDR